MEKKYLSDVLKLKSVITYHIWFIVKILYNVKNVALFVKIRWMKEDWKRNIKEWMNKFKWDSFSKK